MNPMTLFEDCTCLGHDDGPKDFIKNCCLKQKYIPLIEYDLDLGWVFHTIFPPGGDVVCKKRIAVRFEQRWIERPCNEKDLERRIVELLDRCGEDCRAQVRCAAGVADIVTRTTVIEVELCLNRAKLFEAIGQVLAYRQAIDPGLRAEIIALSIEPEAYGIADSARQMGISIKLWDSEKEVLCSI